MGKQLSIFGELKRRNVFRAAAFYAASAWLLVQVATQVFPLFHVAEWVMRWIVVASIIGFPCAIVFSWFYEWTPRGLQRESELSPNESISRQTGRTLDRWIIAILLLAVVLLLTDRLILRQSEKPALASPIPDMRAIESGSLDLMESHDDWYEALSAPAQLFGSRRHGQALGF